MVTWRNLLVTTSTLTYEPLGDVSMFASVGEILSGWEIPADYVSGLYIFVGLGRPLYVGISRNPGLRIYQHLGLADAWNTFDRPSLNLASPIGKLYHAFCPEAKDWRVYFPSMQNLANYLNQHHCFKGACLSPDYNLFSLAERYLIHDLQCPVNSAHGRCDDAANFWRWVHDQRPDCYTNGF